MIYGHVATVLVLIGIMWLLYSRLWVVTERLSDVEERLKRETDKRFELKVEISKAESKLRQLTETVKDLERFRLQTIIPKKRQAEILKSQQDLTKDEQDWLNKCVIKLGPKATGEGATGTDKINIGRQMLRGEAERRDPFIGSTAAQQTLREQAEAWRKLAERMERIGNAAP